MGGDGVSREATLKLEKKSVIISFIYLATEALSDSIEFIGAIQINLSI